VIAHFDRHFDLGLTADEKRDLAAISTRSATQPSLLVRNTVQADSRKSPVLSACSTPPFRRATAR